MRLRAGVRVTAVLFVLGCGRTGIELDELGPAAGNGGAGGTSLVAGAGGAAAGGVVAGGGTAGNESVCELAFSDNGPIGDAVSTFTAVSSSFVCVGGGRVDDRTTSIALESALGRVEGKLVWSAAEGRLTLHPSAPLALATSYTATASLPGAQLVWSFTTTDGEWQPVEEVGQGADVVLAASPDGFGMVAFNAGAVLHVRRFTLAGGLARSDELPTMAEVLPRSVRVDVVNGGTAFLVWGTSGGNVLGARAMLDGGWSPAGALDSGIGPSLVEALAVAGDGTGVLLTSVRSSPDQPGMLRAVPVEPDGFGAASTLTSLIPLDTVRAAARPGGRAWAAWSSWGATGRVLARHIAGNGVFDGELVVGAPAARAGFVVMSEDDSAFAVYQEGSPPRAVKAARFTPEDEPGVAVRLDTAVPGAASSGVYARIAVDDLGRAVALWVNQGETPAGLVEEVRAQRFGGTSWAAQHVALSSATVDEWAVISPTGLALDPQGNGFAAFGHGAPARAWVRRFRETSGWQAPVELSESATAPLLAVDASGRAAVAWASGGKVYLRRFIELTAPRPRH